MAISGKELRGQYTRRYSAIAEQLYRFALILTGCRARAEAAVTAAFVKGYPVLARIGDDHDFLLCFLGEIFRRCRELPGEESYEDAREALGERTLWELLKEASPEERAVLALVCCLGCETACAAQVLDSPEKQVRTLLGGLLRRFSEEKSGAAAC